MKFLKKAAFKALEMLPEYFTGLRALRFKLYPNVGDQLPDGTINAGKSEELGATLYIQNDGMLTGQDGKTPKLSWDDIKAVTDNLAPHGWRLPTADELRPNFGAQADGGWYWSNTDDGRNPYEVGFTDDKDWGYKDSGGNLEKPAVSVKVKVIKTEEPDGPGGMS